MLDSIGLDIEKALVNGARVDVQDRPETIALRAPRTSGNAHIEIGFSGAMNSACRGLYAGDGFAVTQLQPRYARHVFPCFDDPRMKATFDIAVTSDSGDTIITNGGTGALMPPYLLLIAAGPFREMTSGRIRLFSLEDPQRYGRAVNAAAAALDYLEAYLAVPYPWETLDLIVIPSFEADAMESTGAIVFRVGALLDERRARTIVAHEVAHQWFGSLVTPASWADLWLSEGFATWIAAKASGTEENLVREIRAAMGADSAPSARPLRSGASDPKELFDTMAYAKGAAILRMAEAMRGEEAFRREIAEYLSRHRNGNASTNDLWLMSSPAAPFIEHPGVPHLTFEWSGSAIRITRDDAGKRPVPAFLKISLDNGTVALRQELLRDDVTEISMPAPIRWLFGNASATGYYRCTYGGGPLIPTSDLSGPERVALLGDLYDAVWAAESDTLVLLRLVDQMPGDPMAAEISDQLDELLAGRSNRAAAPLQQLAVTAGAERIAACEALLRHPSTRRETWHYLKAHWDAVRHDLISFGGRGAIPALASAADPELRNDIAAFFAEHPPLGAQRALQQTLAQIDARIRFREREQRKYLCRAIWIQGQRPAATAQLRFAHSVLNGLAAALHGSLHMRLLLDQLAIPPPQWMHPAEDLRNAHDGIEQLFLRLFRGEAIVNDGVLQMIDRMREDLTAAAATAEAAIAAIGSGSDEPVKMVAVLASREAVTRESFLGGLIAFVDLFDGEGPAAPWRTAMPAMEHDIARTRMTLARASAGDADPAFRTMLAAQNAALPSTFRSQAEDLAAAGAALRTSRVLKT